MLRLTPLIIRVFFRYDRYMNIDECISVVEKQENTLRFSCFDRKGAWELGQLMASRILREKLELSVSIRLISGLVVFQYAPEGTAVNNENWMTRKFNIVRDMEVSSLLNALRLRKKNQTLESRGLDPRSYAASGGGFPIHVSGTGVIGAVIVSGLPHLEDHGFVVESLGRFLKILNVPQVPSDAGV